MHAYKYATQSLTVLHIYYILPIHPLLNITKEQRMIGWEDVYKVVVAMVPLYFALMLGYGSVKWWKIFTREQCDAINCLVCYFTLPLFTFEFTAHIDPFKMNFLFLGGDTISKFIIVAVLAFWAKFSSKGSYAWSITSFSLSTLTNSLVVGVPLMKAMYGPIGVDLVVQGSVVQAIIWLTVLLFVLEFRRTRIDGAGTKKISSSAMVDSPAALSGTEPSGKDVEAISAGSLDEGMVGTRPSFWVLMRGVWLKLAMNPNSYACILGISWAFVANRWHFEMPTIIEGSILIMSKAGTGTAMFSMGIFMALQEKVIACGVPLTVFGMVLRFIAGPAAMAIGAIAVGLHGDVLRVAIIQSALPQSITSFIFAREYGLHPEVLSTAVIFGMMVSLPVFIAYYAVLEFVH
ncbi:Auxin efflux carrier component [Quillaja saponaria]|uniref:Auxin efflux carrier component n=1 Tax=Quillaja saponaria TaxID=32244 RepID=A0AAD7QBF6_QUISA|nr:Auxin efflux carrier component [Quillaja saponaria]